MEAGRPEEIASARPEQVSAEVIRTAVLPLGPQVSQEPSSNVSATLSTPATGERCGIAEYQNIKSSYHF